MVESDSPSIVERERLRQEEWHDACADCGERFQGGIGPSCKDCYRAFREREADEDRRRAILADTKFARDLLPPWKSWATFDKLVAHPGIDRRLYAEAKAWKRRQGGLIFAGPTGIGKTAVVHAICRRIIATAITAKDLDDDDRRFACNLRWYAASHLALARKQGRLGVGEANAVERASRASLLVIDELGFETSNDGTLFDIVDARYLQRVPTIVTTGRREPALVECYGAAFVRRLRELGTIVDVHPKGDE